MTKQPVPGVHENFAGRTPAPESQTHVNGERKFCDFPNCDCSSGAAERCSHPPVPNVDRWSGIENAPYDTPVRVLAGRMTFIAILRRDASIDCDGRPCDQWQAFIEGEHPPCWTDGGCWENNADDSASLWPEAFKPLNAEDRAALGTTEGSDNG